MKNIYDEIKAHKMYYVPQSKRIKKENAVVLAHLYYSDLVDECCKYLEPLVPYMRVVVSTSNPSIVKIIEDNLPGAEVVTIANNGRDIATLMTIGMSLLQQCDYFCFVHDKKSLHIEDKAHGAIYFKKMWQCMLRDAEYVSGIIDLMKQNDEIGLLVPPVPYEKSYLRVACDGWDGAYKETRRICKTLRLKCRISEDTNPVSFGTCFWARSDALIPMATHVFERTQYFGSEVKKFSYAIERVFPYVAQSEGYYTAYISTKEIASEQALDLQYNQANLLQLLDFLYSYDDIEDVQKLLAYFNEFIAFARTVKKVYILGCSGYAKICIKILEKHGIPIGGIILHEGEVLPEQLDKYSTINLNYIEKCDEDGLALCGDRVEKDEVIAKLRESFACVFYFAL